MEARTSVSASLKRASGLRDTRLQRLAARVAAACGGDGAGNGQKYQLLADLIVSAIEEGIWRCGDRLPSETAFAEAIPLSLGTIQRALGLLVEQGVVFRHQGQGSFVSGAFGSHGRLQAHRFVDGDVFSGQPSTLLVRRFLQRISLTEAKGPWSSFIVSEGRFVRLERRFDIPGKVSMFCESYLPYRRFIALASLPPDAFTGSLTGLLAERFNAPALQMDYGLRVGPVPLEAASVLKVPPGSTVMHWEYFATSWRRTPLLYQRMLIPPTAVRVVIPASEGSPVIG